MLKTLKVGRRRYGVWVLRLLALAALVGGVVGYRSWQESSTQKSRPRYESEAITRGELLVTVSVTGTLAALDTVQVGSEITGRVLKVLVDFDEKVAAGQVLAEIDPEQLQARVDEGNAQLQSALARVKTARATAHEAKLAAERAKGLHERKLLSDQDLERAEASLARAEAEAAGASAQATVARASLRSATTTRSRTIIRSPVDGVVLARSVEPGQTVTSGLQTPVLFTLAKDLRRMTLSVNVDEADVGVVRAGQEATFTVDAYPKRVFSSRVLAVRNMPKASTTVVTYEAVLEVDNSERLLRPGMTATASIVAERKSGVLLVPNTALRFRPARRAAGASSGLSIRSFLPQTGGGRRGGLPGEGAPPGRPPGERGEGGRKPRDAVWILVDDNPKRVPVEIGATDGLRTELLAGEQLDEGAKVLTGTLEPAR